MTRTVKRSIMALCLLAAVAGFWLGSDRLRMTETDAINRVVDAYVAETGGAGTDCFAVPGHSSDVWLEVRCGSQPSVRSYLLNRRGQIIEDAIEPDA